jgi:EmrB/QacA subfamily drug resistance transporter
MVVVLTGVLITAVDTTIVVLALPEIERSLHIALASVIWVVIGYLLVITLLATQVGRLGDMYGRVRMYEAGFFVFIAGSAACALSWNEASIVTFRLLQGVGGALVTANSGAVIADLYPREQRGKAYGYTGIGWSLGAVLGVLAGGAIVTYVSWTWVFWINVPIGLLALLLALRVLHDEAERERHKLDPWGMTTLGLGLFGLLWGITKLATAPLDAELVGYLGGGVAMLALFVLIERAVEEPMLQLSLFKVPSMSPSLMAALLQGLANFAVLFLVIMYLQGPRGLSPIDASLLMVPGYLIGAAFGPIAGRLADRFTAVLPATVGLADEVVALLLYAQLSVHTGLWVVVVAGVINGIGASFFFPANSSQVMKASPPRLFGISSGVLRTFSNVGMVFSFSMAILIASRTISRGLAFAIFVGSASLHGRLASAFTSGLHAAFYVSAGLMVLAAVLSAARSGRDGRGSKATTSLAREKATPALEP